jgi:putative nucleotidyltransferase with HDIG domain
MEDSPRRAVRQAPPGDLAVVPRLRRRVFVRLLLAFLIVLAATLAAIWFAAGATTSRITIVAVGVIAGLVGSTLLALVWSGRFENRIQKLVTVIGAGSPTLSEELMRETSDKLFLEVIRTWQGAVRTLQEGWVEKQDEARRNYQALAELIRMMAKAVDERAAYLRGHSERVSQYSAAMAEKLGLDEKQVEKIRLASLLHDIGTLGIEDYLVTKDGPLSPDEFEIVKAHTVKGAAILRPIEFLHDLIPGVELHHESLDGMGYPFGLKGDEIPLMARIIAVADSFDAMTTPRPYQAAMNSEYVLEIMKRLAGTRYDPAVVNALTVLVRSGAVEVKPMRVPVSFRMRRPMVETA